jgi:hypothetical protein
MTIHLHPDWLIPDWPAPANVRACMTTRAGGVSAGAYASMNVGKSSGDVIGNVEANRARLHQAVGGAHTLRFLHQVHGTRAVCADEVADGEQADAAFTRHTRVACVTMAADCLPVLFASSDGSVVGSAHAGWRGLSAGVLESAIAALGVPTAQLLVWLGPCIGPDAFEVGEEVRAAFVAAYDGASTAFVARGGPGKFHADLVLLARQRLMRAGVHQIYGGLWCTYSEPTRFFSYRRVAQSGRMAAVIWKTKAS